MIDRQSLGRYEYHNDSENSHKFYHIVYDRNQQTYIAAWGRVGTKGQYKAYTEAEALRKIREKIGKGYRKDQSGRYEETIGENSIDWIKQNF